MSTESQDDAFMCEAIELAALGRFMVSPNPCVGALVVCQGEVLSRGYHERFGQAHAEVNALRRLKGQELSNATLYVTLEPCCHQGKTPPCVDALIESGIGRVVVAMEDPNPQMAGKGINQLQNAGIDVVVGVAFEKAQKLNLGFSKRMTQKRPWVKVKVAASLDGRTGMPSGESKWITSEDARRDVQLERAMVDAIITGIGTVLADDPQLKVRKDELDEISTGLGAGERQPLRVVLDSKARLPRDSVLMQSASEEAPIIWVVSERFEAVNVGVALPESVQLLAFPESKTGISLQAVLNYLSEERSINTLMIEAGSTLVGAFLQAQLVDQWVQYQAPLIMGHKSRPLAQFQPLSLSQCPRFFPESIQKFGPDVKSTYRVEYPYPDLLNKTQG